MSKLTLTAEPGSHEIVMIRIFDAPRDLVFKTYTDPAAIALWWGPEGVTTVVDTMEARKGGIWRYIHRDANGAEYAFNGVYHEVVAPERLVSTFEFEPMPGHVLLETVTFEEQPDGTTKLTDSSVFQSVADRDGMLAMGMEAGAAESMDRLAALLAGTR
ncbi:MAG: SRPBCC family protein [Chloroflexia bacterium]|nr:SRPBCC family protein [Chloroflexia bacterium]